MLPNELAKMLLQESSNIVVDSEDDKIIFYHGSFNPDVIDEYPSLVLKLQENLSMEKAEITVLSINIKAGINNNRKYTFKLILKRNRSNSYGHICEFHVLLRNILFENGEIVSKKFSLQEHPYKKDASTYEEAFLSDVLGFLMSKLPGLYGSILFINTQKNKENIFRSLHDSTQELNSFIDALHMLGTEFDSVMSSLERDKTEEWLIEVRNVLWEANKCLQKTQNVMCAVLDEVPEWVEPGN